MGFRYVRHGATDAFCPASQRHHDSAHHDDEWYHDHGEGTGHDWAPVTRYVIAKANRIVARERASGHPEQTVGGHVTSERPATAHHDPEYDNHTSANDHDTSANDHDGSADDHDESADDHDESADDHDDSSSNDDHDNSAQHDDNHSGYDDHGSHHDDHSPDHHHYMNGVRRPCRRWNGLG